MLNGALNQNQLPVTPLPRLFLMDLCIANSVSIYEAQCSPGPVVCCNHRIWNSKEGFSQLSHLTQLQLPRWIFNVVMAMSGNIFGT